MARHAQQASEGKGVAVSAADHDEEGIEHLPQIGVSSELRLE